MLATTTTEAIMTTTHPTTTDDEAAVLTVRVWDDPVVAAHGYPVNSAYTELFYLPILGPSATLALRRLAFLANATPDGARIGIAELACSLGLGTGTGRNSPMVRTVNRLVSFHMARWQGDTLEIRGTVGPLTNRHLERLPRHLAAAHHHYTTARRA